MVPPPPWRISHGCRAVAVMSHDRQERPYTYFYLGPEMPIPRPCWHFEAGGYPHLRAGKRIAGKGLIRNRTARSLNSPILAARPLRGGMALRPAVIDNSRSDNPDNSSTRCTAITRRSQQYDNPKTQMPSAFLPGRGIAAHTQRAIFAQLLVSREFSRRIVFNLIKDEHGSSVTSISRHTPVMPQV